MLPPDVLVQPIAAVSVGMVGGEARLDLCYAEDSQADVDLNVVANAEGEFVELQGTAEGDLFDRTMLNELLDLADLGIEQLLDLQSGALDTTSPATDP